MSWVEFSYERVVDRVDGVVVGEGVYKEKRVNSLLSWCIVLFSEGGIFNSEEEEGYDELIWEVECMMVKLSY